ncbi:hypothetical protein ACJRO7_008466 [Eucalyptus globulus]|uniref:Uncharacterized protein n=1 Tax=Eucalyptus globulus TaxID=34317 RepID=A0ABD3IRS6_EUCGL
MNKSTSNNQSPKVERKTMEKNQRIKNFLNFPFSFFGFRDSLSQQDQLDQAASYTRQLKERIDGLKPSKKQAELQSEGIDTSRFVLLVFQLRDHSLGLELIWISGRRKNFMLYEVINILEEEGAEVVSASFYVIGDKIFHTVHAQKKRLCHLDVILT